ncbi:MAG: signal peptidase I [Thermoanaerobaculia bacterium]
MPRVTLARRKQSLAREYYEAILVAVIFALFVRTFVFQAFQVPSGSMEQTVLIGDHMLVNKFIYAPHVGGLLEKLLPYRTPRRGDVFVFKFPDSPDRDFIKRLVALPGDRLEERDKTVYVNGEPFSEKHSYHTDPHVWPADPALPELSRKRDNFGPIVIPPDRFWAMGDNRDNSYDSRFWGPVPRDNIKGRALLVYWSYEAEPDSAEWRGYADKFGRLVGVALHFFTRTRWDRTFRLVR